MRRTWTLSRRGLAVGGTRRLGGWVVVPRLTVDPLQLTVGINLQVNEFEDPDPLASFHFPGIYLWLRFYRIRPGYRAKRRARRAS